MANPIDFSLLGDSLINTGTGETANPQDVLKGKIVLLYFGAHWVESCSKFTPKLHLFHQLHQQNTNEELEIVFCSMDKSQEEYAAYSEKMPWWCLPYALSTLPRLTTVYQAHGIPHLVILDKDGTLITKSGVDCLTDDPLGESFPWRPKRIVDLLPEYYITEDDNEDEVMLPFTDLDEKYILFYFASNSDNSSQEFTPWLVKAYRILKTKHKGAFEMIFVSGDDSEASFYNYWSKLGCGAIPFEEQIARETLETRLEISSYPTLVMVGPKQDDAAATKGDRAIVNKEVRTVIENGDYVTGFPFFPERSGDLCNTTDDINTHKCLIVFQEGLTEEAQSENEEAIKEAADEYIGDELIKFYWANDSESALSSNIREACRLGAPTAHPIMVLLDVKNNGTFYVSAAETKITTSTIKLFVLNYKNGKKRQI